MLHQYSQVSFVVLLVILVSASLTLASNTRSILNRDENTECDTIVRVSHVCYQCSKRHEEDFNTMYMSCCTGDSAIRDYCEAIYTEPPKRGGLWI